MTSLFDRENCLDCDGTGLVEVKGSPLPAMVGVRNKPCKSCTEHRNRIRMFRKSRAPRHHWEIPLRAVGEITFFPGKVDFKRITNMNATKALAEPKDITLVINNAQKRIILTTILIRSLIMHHGYRTMFVTAEEIIIAALEQSKYGTTSVDVVDIEKLEHADFLVIEGAHEFCSTAGTTTQTRAVVNNLFQRRCFAGKRNIFMSSRNRGEFKTFGTKGNKGFVFELIMGGYFVELIIRSKDVAEKEETRTNCSTRKESNI